MKGISSSRTVGRHILLLPLWVLMGLMVQRPTIADPLTTVYAYASYTQAEFEVLVCSDIAQTNLRSFGVNVGYDPSDLRVVEAQKNEQTWYFGEATTTFPYKNPDTSTIGSVVIIGGKLDVGDPTAGVTGNATPLGRVSFARETSSIPSISLSLGIAGAYGNFVATDGTVIEDQAAQLIFSPVTVVPRPNADVDGNGVEDALTDGLLIIRYLFGFRGTTLTDGAVGGGCTRCTAAEIEPYLDETQAGLDVDGNCVADALTDGLSVIRYLFGFLGATLTDGAVGGGCARCTASEIEAYLATLMLPD